MASAIPGAQRKVIPSAGHSANIDNPEEFNKTILGFLGKLNLPKG
jgi:pimeloyl-ACP methyl ester carboxylesterase